jgi:hypothetical protein
VRHPPCGDRTAYAAQTRREQVKECGQRCARQGPPASPPETLRVTMWRGTRSVAGGFSYTVWMSLAGAGYSPAAATSPLVFLRHHKCRRSNRCDAGDAWAQTLECNLPCIPGSQVFSGARLNVSLPNPYGRLNNSLSTYGKIPPWR